MEYTIDAYYVSLSTFLIKSLENVNKSRMVIYANSLMG